MRRTYSSLLILLFLSGCTEKVDPIVTRNFIEYKEAKDYLIENLDEIDQSRNYTTHDSIFRAQRNTIFASNRYYFENTLVSEYPGLKDYAKLWEKNLIENNKVIQALVLTSDSTVKFIVKGDVGFFSGTAHSLIYTSNDCCKNEFDKYTNIEFEKKIEDDWYYVVTKRFYAD